MNQTTANSSSTSKTILTKEIQAKLETLVELPAEVGNLLQTWLEVLVTSETLLKESELLKQFFELVLKGETRGKVQYPIHSFSNIDALITQFELRFLKRNRQPQVKAA